MKTTKKSIRLTLLSLFVGMSCFASNGKGENKNTSINSTKISQQLALPQELKKQGFNEKVNIQFRVDENGKITCIDACTNNSTLKSSIEQQFSKLEFAELSANVKYNVDVNFVVY